MTPGIRPYARCQEELRPLESSMIKHARPAAVIIIELWELVRHKTQHKRTRHTTQRLRRGHVQYARNSACNWVQLK